MAQTDPRSHEFAPNCDSCQARALVVVTCIDEDIGPAIRRLFGADRARGVELVNHWRARMKAAAVMAAAKGAKR